MSSDRVVEALVPAAGPTPIADLLQLLTSPAPQRPYSDETVDLCADLSRRLAKSAGANAEVQALAFWMRRSELRRLQQNYQEMCSGGVMLAPRGLVFHLPPSNVDTIFVYSWLLSVMAGNTNIIRLSDRRGDSSDRILTALNEVLADTESATSDIHTAVIAYGHDDQVTRAISAVSDVRVIWGGDQTVRDVRSVPLPPHATELTFPDRSSLVVMNATFYTSLDEAGQLQVAERLFNDTFWFDQMACSSPRVLVWIADQSTAALASVKLFDHLQHVIQRRGYQVDTATALNKLTYRSRAAIDHPLDGIRAISNELTVLSSPVLPGVGSDYCGAGTFWQTRYDRLSELVPLLERRHQTLAHFGFSAEEISRLAGDLNGRGVDRLVPVGEALTFGRYWDGHDLMRSFLRAVYVQTETRSL